MGYIQIPFEEIRQFLEDRSFVFVRKIRKYKETGFKKKFDDKNLMIVIMTSFERNNKQRGYGKDAIRCQLQSRWEEKHPMMDLSSTKRIDGWKETLGNKIDLLESLIQTARPCPKCGSDMKVIHGKFEDPVLWLCSKSRSDTDRCSGNIKPNLKLQKELAAVWPEYKKKK